MASQEAAMISVSISASATTPPVVKKPPLIDAQSLVTDAQLDVMEVPPPVMSFL
jgi:hypothetical protein